MARTFPRNIGVDVLRLFSVAAVVLGHAYLEALTVSAYLEIWRMPLFFFLTGYFWTRGRSFRADLGSRWRSLGIPYLVWAVLMSVAAVRFAGGDAETLGEMLRTGWYGGVDQDPPWWAFWFISVLFFTALLARGLERAPWPVAWLVAAGGLAFSWLVPDSAIARTPLSVGLAFPCLFFVLCGELFRRRVEPRIPSSLTLRFLLGAAAVTAGLGAVAGGLEPHTIKYGGFGTPVLTPLIGVLIACGMVLIFGSTVNEALTWLAVRTGAGRAIRAVVSALVRTGTVVVLVHGYVLMELMNAGGHEPLARFLIALGVSWAVGVVLLATPASQLLTGVPRQFGAPVSPARRG